MPDGSFTTGLRDAARSSNVFTVESLGATQHVTPDGFLLCENVPIARTGSQTYAAGEVPLEPGRDGLIHITRDEADVFHPITLASINGKPVVDDHPDDGKVTPDTWRQKAVGVVLNPRRGDGLMFDNDYIYADLLIQDKQAIQAVRDGKRQLSCGYDAEYEQLAPGRGRQHSIIVNHVALVDKGRCGPRCAIGDNEMATRMSAFRSRLHRLGLSTRDEAAVLNALAETPKDPDVVGEVVSGDEAFDPASVSGGDPAAGEARSVIINVHGGKAEPAPSIMPGGDAGAVPAPAAPAPATPAGGDVGQQLAAIMQRLDQLEQVVAIIAQGEEGEEDPDGDPAHPEIKAGEGESEKEEPPRYEAGDKATTGDRRATVGDSTSMREAFQQMVANAEILKPGVAFPTFDTAAPAKKTGDAMCAFRRRTLDAAKGDGESGKAIAAVLAGKVPTSFADRGISCETVSLVFDGAAAIIAEHNRGRTIQPHMAFDGKPRAAMTPAEINKKNAEYYATH